MTILAKPSAVIKKPDIINGPIADKTNFDEEKVEFYANSEYSKYSVKGLICLALSLLAILGFSGGLVLCREMWKTNTFRRYQGYCSIPIPNDIKEMIDPSLRSVPLSWIPEEVQLVTMHERDTAVDALREELDLGDTVEKISVVNDGHRVNFIHDFTDNTTGIVDDERCFVMELEPELVLSPELFISGLQSGAEFDVSRVRSELRAALPALRELRRAASELATRCAARPIYRLHRDSAIRKRSVDELPHDYIEFAGKHVQEIKISNLQEILEYEKQNKS